MDWQKGFPKATAVQQIHCGQRIWQWMTIFFFFTSDENGFHDNGRFVLFLQCLCGILYRRRIENNPLFRAFVSIANLEELGSVTPSAVANECWPALLHFCPEAMNECRKTSEMIFLGWLNGLCVRKIFLHWPTHNLYWCENA